MRTKAGDSPARGGVTESHACGSLPCGQRALTFARSLSVRLRRGALYAVAGDITFRPVLVLSYGRGYPNIDMRRIWCAQKEECQSSVDGGRAPPAMEQLF